MSALARLHDAALPTAPIGPILRRCERLAIRLRLLFPATFRGQTTALRRSTRAKAEQVRRIAASLS
jgi:tRNA(Leu) C34 or U34 (ribose-2'-O)-methylase TrmL